MQCPTCGYEMSEFDKRCPRCERMRLEQQRRTQQAQTASPEPPSQQFPPVSQPVDSVVFIEGTKRQHRAMVWAIISIIICPLGILALYEESLAARLGYPNHRAKTLGWTMLILWGMALVIPLLTRLGISIYYHYYFTTLLN